MYQARSVYRIVPRTVQLLQYASFRTTSYSLNGLKTMSKAIEALGPIPISHYMRYCLTSEKGYYTTQQPFGKSGDFITSPEISQMFGELIGIWFFSIWREHGKPSNINFIEFGPGKGTLLLDCLHTFRKLSTEAPKLNVILVEASDKLAEVQHSKLCGENELKETEDGLLKSKHKFEGDIIWAKTEVDVQTLIQGSTATNFVIAHEFFDALPIRQFVKREEGWREILVDYNPETKKLFLTQAKAETPSSALLVHSERFKDSPLGSVVEISPDAEKYGKSIIDIVGDSGAALIVDYGPAEGVPTYSLRGIKDHKFVNPFENPGEVDLSVDVDFTALKNLTESSENAQALGPVEQGDWLVKMGIMKRTEQLYQSAQTKEQKEFVLESARRLVTKDDRNMGSIYKFLGIVPKGKDSDAVGFS